MVTSTPSGNDLKEAAEPGGGALFAAGKPAPSDFYLFAVTSFLSAYLLFQMQLIVAKYILPWFGGTAAVWTTCMVVFQVLLLAGYLYAHFVATRLTVEAQRRLHLGVLMAAAMLILALSILWPSAITPGAAWKPGSVDHPALKVGLIILLAAGLPFFVLSTSAPLLQRWFAGQRRGVEVYRLYALSNLGSMVGLLAFPILIEPVLRMKTQGRVWSLLFVVYAGLCAACAIRARDAGVDSQGSESDPSHNAVVTGSTRVLWFALPAAASALLLATTNLLCQEVISLPLLWVVPLVLYLLSFILCFDHPRWYRRGIFHPLFAVGLFGLCLAMNYAQAIAQVIGLPLVLFVACMICHGELVRLKPATTELTGFYLSISAGGATGGLFVSVIAPYVFRFYTEFQWSLAAVVVLLAWCLWRDSHSWFYQLGAWLPAAIVISAFIAAYTAASWIPSFGGLLAQVRFYPLLLITGTMVVAGAFLQRSAQHEKGFRFVQVLAGIGLLLCGIGVYKTALPESTLYRGERNFYGAIRIYELAQGGKALFHGRTMHGAQLNPPNERLPMAYYAPDTGIGILLRNHPRRARGDGSLRVGVVGLGAGTLAVYGRPGDYFRYYEINPQVVDVAAGPQPVFTYIRDSRAQVEVALGDARVLLEREAAAGAQQNFDVLVLDAFSGDAIPVHLLTREAFDTYWQHLGGDGIIAIHVSARHINLMPVVEGLAEHFHARVLARFTDNQYPFLPSLWVLMSRRPEALDINGLIAAPPPFANELAPRLWTDDYSDIFRLLY